MRRKTLTWLVAFGALLYSCGNPGAVSAELLVSAAASLTDAFSEIESAFEADNPDVDVVLNLAGSSALREQILEGAPADVFASANMANMQQLEQAGHLTGSPAIFARNRLQIAVPPGNPGGVTGLEDFSREELFIGLCAEPVPCGQLAREVLSEAGVTAAVDTANYLPAGTTFWIEAITGQDYIYFITEPGDSGDAIIMDPGSSQ